MAERLVVVLLLAVAVLLLTSLAGGLVSWATEPSVLGISPSNDAGRILVQIGQAPLLLSLPILFPALGLLWWRVNAWSVEEAALEDELDEADDDDDAGVETDELTESFGHLDRLRFLATVLLVLAVGAALAVVAYGVGTVLEADGLPAAQQASTYLASLGIAFVELIALGAVLAAAPHVRGLASRPLSSDDDDEEVEVEDDAVDAPAGAAEEPDPRS